VLALVPIFVCGIHSDQPGSHWAAWVGWRRHKSPFCHVVRATRTDRNHTRIPKQVRGKHVFFSSDIGPHRLYAQHAQCFTSPPFDDNVPSFSITETLLQQIASPMSNWKVPINDSHVRMREKWESGVLSTACARDCGLLLRVIAETLGYRRQHFVWDAWRSRSLTVLVASCVVLGKSNWDLRLMLWSNGDDWKSRPRPLSSTSCWCGFKFAWWLQ